MLLKVKVVPRAKSAKVLREGGLSPGSGQDGLMKVHVKAPPVEGRANRELIEVLAKHFNVRKGSIRIIRGVRSRQKTVEINL